jgi:hypothetical protein
VSIPANDLLDGTELLVALSQELLDAHCDTMRLAETDASSLEWRVHLEYLRDLQRVGKRALAGAASCAESI